MSKRLILIVSAVCSVLIVSGALVLAAKKREHVAAAQVVVQRPVSKAELAKADGKNGHVCYVAVDGIVYQIKDFSLWQNGEHKTSKGLAYCGADMSQVITKSPHGKKVLDLLIKIGPLKTT
jgi:predicted heme/steroid binding protein